MIRDFDKLGERVAVTLLKGANRVLEKVNEALAKRRKASR
jgi:ribonuclease HIII